MGIAEAPHGFAGALQIALPGADLRAAELVGIETGRQLPVRPGRGRDNRLGRRGNGGGRRQSPKSLEHGGIAHAAKGLQGPDPVALPLAAEPESEQARLLLGRGRVRPVQLGGVVLQAQGRNAGLADAAGREQGGERRREDREASGLEGGRVRGQLGCLLDHADAQILLLLLLRQAADDAAHQAQTALEQGEPAQGDAGALKAQQFAQHILALALVAMDQDPVEERDRLLHLAHGARMDTPQHQAHHQRQSAVGEGAAQEGLAGGAEVVADALPQPIAIPFEGAAHLAPGLEQRSGSRNAHLQAGDALQAGEDGIDAVALAQDRGGTVDLPVDALQLIVADLLLFLHQGDGVGHRHRGEEEMESAEQRQQR